MTDESVRRRWRSPMQSSALSAPTNLTDSTSEFIHAERARCVIGWRFFLSRDIFLKLQPNHRIQCCKSFTMAALWACALCHVTEVRLKIHKKLRQEQPKQLLRWLKEPPKHYVYFYSLAHGDRSRVAKTQRGSANLLFSWNFLPYKWKTFGRGGSAINRSNCTDGDFLTVARH